MPDSVTVTLTLEQSVREVLSAADVPAAATENDRTLRHNNYNADAKLDSTTIPKAERAAMKDVTIAGTITIDFSAAPKSGGRTEDMTGKKVVSAIFKTGAANAAAITISPGASNPYPLWGAAKAVILGPGRTEAFAFAAGVDSNLPAVAGAVKTLDISGTNGDTLSLELVFGT